MNKRDPFWTSPNYHVIKAMKAGGNRPGVIAQWKKLVEEWAQNAVNDPNAAGVRAWLPMWQVRPFYTAEELAPIFPALAVTLGYADKIPEVQKSASLLALDLNYGSALSQAAHVVILIHRKAYYAERKPHAQKSEHDIRMSQSRETTLVVDKARGGRRAHIEAIMDIASAVLIEDGESA